MRYGIVSKCVIMAAGAFACKPHQDTASDTASASTSDRTQVTVHEVWKVADKLSKRLKEEKDISLCFGEVSGYMAGKKYRGPGVWLEGSIGNVGKGCHKGSGYKAHGSGKGENIVTFLGTDEVKIELYLNGNPKAGVGFMDASLKPVTLKDLCLGSEFELRCDVAKRENTLAVKIKPYPFPTAKP